jgi:hypothetical protein
MSPFDFAFPQPQGFLFIGFLTCFLRGAGLGFFLGMKDHSLFKKFCRFVQSQFFHLRCLTGVVLIVSATRSPKPVSLFVPAITQSKQ